MRNNATIYAIILGLLMAAFFLPSGKAPQPAEVSAAAAAPIPEVEAKAALAENLRTGEILFSKNPDESLPLASITKIVTLFTLLDLSSPDEETVVSKKAVLTPEPSSLRVGEHLAVRDLFAMAMVASSNDSITVLVEHATAKNGILSGDSEGWFLEKMREKTEALGLQDMVFYNTTGLDISASIAGAYGSAADLIKIAKASLDSPLWQFGELREVVSKEGIKHVLKPTNELYPYLPELVGAKTGFTDLAGGNLLVIVEHPLGNPIGIVVLGSSESGRFSDVQKIFEWIKYK